MKIEDTEEKLSITVDNGGHYTITPDGIFHYNVMINGRKLRMFEGTLSYEQLVKLAFGEDANVSLLYTVTVSCLGRTLKPGDTLHLSDGMRIHIMGTGNA